MLRFLLRIQTRFNNIGYSDMHPKCILSNFWGAYHSIKHRLTFMHQRFFSSYSVATNLL